MRVRWGKGLVRMSMLTALLLGALLWYRWHEGERCKACCTPGVTQSGVHLIPNSARSVQGTSTKSLASTVADAMKVSEGHWHSAVPESSVTEAMQTAESLGNYSLSLCPPKSPHLVGPLATYKQALSWGELGSIYPDVKSGGHFTSRDCLPRHRVAIVVPFRNRDLHLRLLLHNLHPILMRQQLRYRIFVVELVARVRNGIRTVSSLLSCIHDKAMPTTFNRGLLMNVGFLEARKLGDFDCFIFHDVDLVPENDRNLYTCSSQPQHLSVAVDKFMYRLPYTYLMGGVVAFTPEQFRKVNGFSNVFFGWGGEDDDLQVRTKRAGMKILRPPEDLARYRMLKHARDDRNAANPKRFELMRDAAARAVWDGLSSVEYPRRKVEEHPLYTHILVSVDQGAILKKLSEWNDSRHSTMTWRNSTDHSKTKSGITTEKESHQTA